MIIRERRQAVPRHHRGPRRPQEPPHVGRRYRTYHGAGARGAPCIPTLSHLLLLVIPARSEDQRARHPVGGRATHEAREPRGVAARGQAGPLTPFQRALVAVLASEPTEDRCLAGGAALHFAPNSAGYSDDLDFFHDSETRVAVAFAADRTRLERAGYTVQVEFSQPGFVRTVVSRGADATRVDWAHDSAWRFMPLVRDPLGGLLLPPLDLPLNKVLAVAGPVRPPGSSPHLSLYLPAP